MDNWPMIQRIERLVFEMLLTQADSLEIAKAVANATHHVIDPVCVFHGLRRSEHACLVCCLCFRDLTPAECHVRPDGQREDVCQACAGQEPGQAGPIGPEAGSLGTGEPDTRPGGS